MISKVRKRAFLYLQVINVVLLFAAMAKGQSQPAKTETGTVCISTVPKPNSEQISLGNPAGGNRSFNYVIQIGSQKASATTEHSVALKGLSTNKPLLAKIFRDGKLVESFRFSFSKIGSNHLCLWYKSLYETWTLVPTKGSKDKCRC